MIISQHHTLAFNLFYFSSLSGYASASLQEVAQTVSPFPVAALCEPINTGHNKPAR